MRSKYAQNPVIPNVTPGILLIFANPLGKSMQCLQRKLTNITHQLEQRLRVPRRAFHWSDKTTSYTILHAMASRFDGTKLEAEMSL